MVRRSYSTHVLNVS